MFTSKHLVIAALMLSGSGSVSCAQLLSPSWDTPDGDRWMYPFNGTPGTRFTANTFGVPMIEGFDDRDAQFILMFETGGEIPGELGLDAYRVVSARVTVTVYNDREFFYDGTTDPIASYRPTDDPLHETDTDTGRPIEIFPLGYRDGFSLASWQENSAFTVSGDPFIDASRIRTAFAAAIDADGNATDVSLAVRDQIDAPALATGTAPLTPGQAVPADTTFSFDLDLCDAGVRRYFAEAFDHGRLNLVVASMHGASYDPDIGPSDPAYPIYYTSENPLALAFGYTPTLELVVRVGSAGDYNGDGTRDFFDVLAFLNDFSAGAAVADLNTDCTIDFFDVLQFLNEFSR